MSFKVYTDNKGRFDLYEDEAVCSRDGSVLIVEVGEREIVYGPNGWIRVESDGDVRTIGGSIVVETAWPISVVMPDPISVIVN